MTTNNNHIQAALVHIGEGSYRGFPNLALVEMRSDYAGDGTIRFDRGEIRGRVSRTDEGYVRGEAVITRTGIFNYRNADGSTRKELRHPDEVFSRASLDSFKMIPVTNGHPSDRLVNARNARELTIGHTGETIVADGRFVIASLNITHANGVAAIDAGRKELSCGYTVDLIAEDGEYDGEKYSHRQTNIRGNHVAIVDVARAGGAARLNLDGLSKEGGFDPRLAELQRSRDYARGRADHQMDELKQHISNAWRR